MTRSIREGGIPEFSSDQQFREIRSFSEASSENLPILLWIVLIFLQLPSPHISPQLPFYDKERCCSGSDSDATATAAAASLVEAIEAAVDEEADEDVDDLEAGDPGGLFEAAPPAEVASDSLELSSFLTM